LFAARGEGGGRKQIGRQVEGFSLFGCAAVGGRGIQHKKEYLLARTTFEDICEKLGKTTICQWFFCSTTIRKKSFFVLFSYLKEEGEILVAIVPHVRFPKGNFRVTAVRGEIV